jgi:hypothetical protein
VNGTLVDLDAYPDFAFAYALWDSQPGNPLAANYFAATLKSLLYRLASAYPNLKYLVLVGDDRVIPHRRIQDTTLVANERNYVSEISTTATLSGSLNLRYFLSDDYYAGLLPLPFQGRELYLPHVAIGRLVESPSEIAGQIEAFIARPTLTPQDALVTGYDFLTDQARAISNTLVVSYGLGASVNTQLINDAWTGTDYRNTLSAQPNAFDLMSLNSHFAHYLFYPNGAAAGSNLVYATEVAASTSYSGTLAFSVGCHSGLNVPDDGATYPADWAQALLRQRGTFIGNTGYGYGDSDSILYSERLMVNFVQNLGYWRNNRIPTVGLALMRAKQRYFHNKAGNSFSNYDEKAMAELTLYGLPMVQVSLPVTTTVAPQSGEDAVVGALRITPEAPVAESGLGGIQTISATPSYTYTEIAFVTNTTANGTYFTVQGITDTAGAAGRPLQPVFRQDVSVSGTIAHGVLMLGGTFTDYANINPVVSTIVTEDIYLNEPAFSSVGLYPSVPGTINRFVSIDGSNNAQLVVVPGQFRSTGSTTGTQRLYSSLTFEVYHAPAGDDDFVPPSIYQVTATPFAGQTVFTVTVADASNAVVRVIVLYRPVSGNSWAKVELTQTSPTQWAGAANATGLDYFAQAVDASGNVAVGLNYGAAFSSLLEVFLPLIRR